MVDGLSVRFKNARVEKMPLNIRIQWNAGTGCVSECALKTLACRGLRVGPSKVLFSGLPLRIRLPLTGVNFPVKNPKIGKREFRSQKTPICPTPEKGVSSQKIPISIQGTTGKMGIFWLQTPFSGVGGNGGFLTPKPSFPDFGVFDPCKGQTDSQAFQ